jgi:hypothetical protein
MRRRLVLAFALSSMLTLSSCAMMTALDGRTETIDVNAVACQAFAPIAWSERDTDLTIRHIKEHNAVWIKLCRPTP